MILTGFVFGLDLGTIIHVRCSLTDIFINRPVSLSLNYIISLQIMHV